jgi:hypothetical protein
MFTTLNQKTEPTYLERIENFQNNEPVALLKEIRTSQLNIFFRKILTQNGKLNLGADEYNLIKENYLNTIGNLTLSGNNGKLGNKSFEDKQ